MILRLFFSEILCLLAASLMGQTCPKVPQSINTYYQWWGSRNNEILQAPRHAAIAGCPDTAMIYYDPTDQLFHYYKTASTLSALQNTDSVFLQGFGTPQSTTGVNGQRYWDKAHGFVYQKVAGSWQYNGILYADTTYMHDSTQFQGPILKVKQWSPLAQNWNTACIQRNKDNPGNTGLPYLDDPVIINGWNVDVNGSVQDPSLPIHIWQHESNFKTDPFQNVPFYEDHISIGWPAGTPAAAYFSAENAAARIESILTNQVNAEVYKYSTKSREFWQWPLVSGGPSTTYFSMSPQRFGGLTQLYIDSPSRSNAVISINGYSFLSQIASAASWDKYVFSRSGFQDTADLAHGTGDFYYKVGAGGTGIVRLGGNVAFLAVGDRQSGIDPGLYGAGAMQVANPSIPNAKLTVIQGGVFGMTLNANSSGIDYLNINSADLGQYFNMHFKHNCTFADSIGGGIRYNMEKSIFGSTTTSSMVGTSGYEFNLNYRHRFGTSFTSLTDAAGNYIPKWEFMSFQPGGSTLDTVVHVMPTGAASFGSIPPDASAKVDIQSTSQGLLPPRMTTVQKLAISAPAEGLQVYDLTLHQMSYYNGTTWVNF